MAEPLFHDASTVFLLKIVRKCHTYTMNIHHFCVDVFLLHFELHWCRNVLHEYALLCMLYPQGGDEWKECISQHASGERQGTPRGADPAQAAFIHIDIYGQFRRSSSLNMHVFRG